MISDVLWEAVEAIDMWLQRRPDAYKEKLAYIELVKLQMRGLAALCAEPPDAEEEAQPAAPPNPAHQVAAVLGRIPTSFPCPKCKMAVGLVNSEGWKVFAAHYSPESNYTKLCEVSGAPWDVLDIADDTPAMG